MNSELVRKRVLKFTEQEKRYLNNPALSESYQFLKKVTVNGEQVYLFDHNVFSDDVAIKIHPRFMPVPAHIHAFIEMAYIYSGSFSQVINGRHVVLRQGDLLIVDTGVVHSTKRAGENDIIINILIRPSFFTNDFLKRALRNSIVIKFIINAISRNRHHGNYVIFNVYNNRRIAAIIEELIIENHDQARSKTWVKERVIINENYIVLLFIELCREWSGREVADFTAQNTEEKLIKVLTAIDENYKSIAINTLAQQLGVSANYLSRLIKKKTGKTFKELVHEKRLARAALLLQNTTMPIYEISADVGYENQTFFYLKFKEHYQMLPNLWRQSAQKNPHA